MKPINIDIVVARPGARGDFVAGWLGMLPNYVDTQWRIDPVTGRSLGLMSCFKDIDRVDYGTDTLDRLLGFRGYQRAASDWRFAMACHGYGLGRKIQDQENLRVIHITDSGANKQKIDWEYIAKTYFSKERYESSLEQGLFYNIDKELDNATNEQRCQTIVQRAQQVQQQGDLKLDLLTTVNLDYSRLFERGGSWYLANSLDLICDAVYHRLWDTYLELADSDSSYLEFGRLWTVSNYSK